MESRMRTTESTEGTRLRQSNWGETSHLYSMHCVKSFLCTIHVTSAKKGPFYKTGN